MRTKERAWSSRTITKVLRELSGFNTPPLGENRTLTCPVCSIGLGEVNYQGTSNIVVNPCEDLHGVWLDSGEIAKIQIFMEYWKDYAKEHEAEINADLDEISKEYEARIDRIIESGPSSSKTMNAFLYEALETLERWSA